MSILHWKVINYVTGKILQRKEKDTDKRFIFKVMSGIIYWIKAFNLISLLFNMYKFHKLFFVNTNELGYNDCSYERLNETSAAVLIFSPLDKRTHAKSVFFYCVIFVSTVVIICHCRVPSIYFSCCCFLRCVCQFEKVSTIDTFGGKSWDNHITLQMDH